MEPFQPHPGLILSIVESGNAASNIVTLTPADEVPEEHQFVYLDAQGQEVASGKQAVERIPIVEVRMTAVDKMGKLVPAEQSQTMYIREYGPDKRILRSTTMIKP